MNDDETQKDQQEYDLKVTVTSTTNAIVWIIDGEMRAGKGQVKPYLRKRALAEVSRVMNELFPPKGE